MTSNKYQAKTGTAPQQSDCGFSGHRVESNRVSNKMKIDFVQYLKLPLDYVPLPNLLKVNQKVRDRTGRGREGELVGGTSTPPALFVQNEQKMFAKHLQLIS